VTIWCIIAEDVPLSSSDIDVQLLEAAKAGDLETVQVFLWHDVTEICLARQSVLCGSVN
jgi:hypothetical protein